jgi:hypothetical protein
MDLTNDSDGLSALRRLGLSDQTLTLELEKPRAAIDESSEISTTQIDEVAFITV